MSKLVTKQGDSRERRTTFCAVFQGIPSKWIETDHAVFLKIVFIVLGKFPHFLYNTILQKYYLYLKM